MEVTFWSKLLISIVIAAIIGIIAALVVRRCNDAKVGIGCGLMFPVAFVVFIILQIIVPDVVVVTDNDGSFVYETKTMLSSIKSPSGKSFSLSINDKYIANFSNETLILYPEYYGPENKANSVKAKDPIIIEPNTVAKVETSPDYYFTPAASQISSKSNDVEVRWVLESLRSIANREGYEYEE